MRKQSMSLMLAALMIRKQTGRNNSGFDGSSEDGSGRDDSRDHGRRRSQGCETDLYMVGQSAEK